MKNNLGIQPLLWKALADFWATFETLSAIFIFLTILSGLDYIITALG
jgi:hypothetical protein